DEIWHESLLQRYESVSLVSDRGEPSRPLVGERRAVPEFSEDQKELLRSGHGFIHSAHNQHESSSVFVVKPLDQRIMPGLALIGEIKPAYIINIREEFFGDLEVGRTIVENGRVVYSTLPQAYSSVIVSQIPSRAIISKSFSWGYGDREFLSSCAPVYLRNIFEAPTWTLVLSESRRNIQAPISAFKYTFVLVFLTAFFAVILLSMNQIRKNLVPLHRLKQATSNLAGGDLSSRVAVDSGDEFQDLAESFNAMAATLDSQFKTLGTMADIDRAILSVIDTENIVDTFIERVSEILPCDSVGICLSERARDNSWHSYTRDIIHRGNKIVRSMHIPKEELSHLRSQREHMIKGSEQRIPAYLEDISNQGMFHYYVMPILLANRVSAIIILANRHERKYSRKEIELSRQIVDRMAVALSNASLFDDLNRLNMGTLTALARVVDAKSPWTAGHSERVADLAVRIGEVMGLSSQELEMLNKAGLLHDIGKISTPRSILDKKGRLTGEEYLIIKEHPEQGVRILEPIAPYRDLLPIVLQHHERYDGKGYPDGISGNEISICGRILGVADAFDAMISDRPYRSGMSLRRVLEEMKNEAGRQFDPEVVDALVKISDEQAVVEECACMR
ncbi:MAG TPA: HD domain-containing protein, partial [Deltaproteobacteria bacterium]|nr:HD domain-containing protein [Deltaproteobacteria bacterium]